MTYTSSLTNTEKSRFGEYRKETVWGAPEDTESIKSLCSLLQTLWEFIMHPFPAAAHTHICPALRYPGPGEEAQARVLAPSLCDPDKVTLPS